MARSLHSRILRLASFRKRLLPRRLAVMSTVNCTAELMEMGSSRLQNSMCLIKNTLAEPPAYKTPTAKHPLYQLSLCPSQTPPKPCSHGPTTYPTRDPIRPDRTHRILTKSFWIPQAISSLVQISAATWCAYSTSTTKPAFSCQLAT